MGACYRSASTLSSSARTRTSSGLPSTSPVSLSLSDTSYFFRKGNVFNYAVSAPLRKVRQQGGEEVLLAWEMNGQPLPKIHGYPLRVVVTGFIGARSCKWVYRINAIEEPSMGPVQRQEYLYYTSQASSHKCVPDSVALTCNFYRLGNRTQSIQMVSLFRTCLSRECASSSCPIPLNRLCSTSAGAQSYTPWTRKSSCMMGRSN